MEVTLNERVRLLRNNLAISQQEFSHAIGTTPTTLSRIEQGHAIPRKSTIQNICKAYNISIEWLLHGKGEMLLPGRTINPEQVNWKDEAYSALKNHNEDLKKEIEWLRSILSKTVGVNFLDGIGSALGVFPVSTVSAA